MAVGKWHLGLGDAPRTDYSKPLVPGTGAAGFDESFIVPASLDMPPYVFVRNDRPTTPPDDEVAASKMRRHGGGGFWRAGAIAPGFRHVDTLPALAEQAVGFINDQSSDAPFFLYFPLTAPHTPWMPLAKYRDRAEAGYYGDFVVQVDAVLGAVLDALDEKQLADNTLVIFTSDNGAHWQPDDIKKWGHRANHDWRGQKSDLWEGGHRVPFIVRWPGVVAADSQSDRLVCLTDVMATLAEVVNVDLPSGAAEDSFSFLSALVENSSDAPQREAIVHHSGDGTFAVRQGDWKLATKLGSHGFSKPRIVEPTPGGPRGQLYHLGSDPAESKNLWLQKPEIVERLSALLSRLQHAGRSRPAD